MDYREYEDEENVRFCRQGDDEAMEYLLKKYRGMVRKETRKLYLIGAEEEDLTQEGMIGLFKAIRDYDLEKGTDFALFAHVCIVRQLYSAVTASNRKKNIPLNEYTSLYATVEKEDNPVTLENVLRADGVDPEEQVLAREKETEIWEQIDKQLSNMEKEVLKHYLKGDSYSEIAGKLGKEKKAIDNAIQRIRAKLSGLRNLA